MFYLVIALLTGYLFYKSIMLTQGDDGLSAAIATGTLFAMLTGMSFILGGWFVICGAVFFIMALSAFLGILYPNLRLPG